MVDEVDVVDKPNEAPAEAGQAEVDAPPAPAPEDVMREELAVEDAATPDAAEGTSDGQEEAVDVDSTSMAQESVDPLLERVKSHPDFANATFKSPEEFLDSVANLRKRLSQRDEDAALGREFQTHRDQFQQYLQHQEAQEDKTAFNPPPMPVGMDLELQKPADQQDPKKIEQYNTRQRYINDRWQEWMTDPNKMQQELILPSVERLIDAKFQLRDHQRQAEAVIDSNKEFAEQHADEISQLMKRGNPLADAIELLQYRYGAKPQEAAKARVADANKLASKKPSGPKHATPSRRPPETEVDMLDPGSIMRAELAKGPVDTDPLALD